MTYAAMEGLAVAVVAKAGTQSISEACSGWYMTDEQAAMFPRRLMFIRNPFERLKSAYSFFNHLKNTGITYGAIDFPDEALASWEGFVDYILVNEDEHWAPQVDSLAFTGPYAPTDVLRFEDINKWWPRFFTIAINRINAAPRLATTTYRQSDLDAYYAGDSAAWQSARIFDDIEDTGTWP